MDLQEIVKGLVRVTESKIVFLVLDGLGGLPVSGRGETELELAHHPNMDKLAKEGVCGLFHPVGLGITPGSGPGHLSLFGYDPFKYVIGRGVLEALGIDFPLKLGDVAIRINFCTVDEKGFIIDRRAGRISTEVNAKLCEKLRKIDLEDVKLFVEPVREHRAVMVLRGTGLSAELNDTDPQITGKMPMELKARDSASRRTKAVVEKFLAKAKVLLQDEYPANMVLLRGFSSFQRFPTFQELYGLKAVALAYYPMYRGIARLVGMEIVEVGDKFEDLVSMLSASWSQYTFFFLHIKKTDSAGEDGDWARKVEAIEQADHLIPDIKALKPDVLLVTGDHSTPSLLKAHSWHPVPFILWSKTVRPDKVKRFTELDCLQGGMGQIPGVALLPLALAHSGKLEKFGA